MQNAGISPEAVSRKGQEERNKENRQRDSRIMAGLRKGDSGTGLVVVKQDTGSGGRNYAGGKTICTTVAAFGDRGMVAIGEGCCFRGGRCPRILCGVLIPNGRSSIDHL